MTKLLNANFHELFQSKSFYITVLVCAFFGAFLTAGMYLYPHFDMPENSDIVLTQENILSIVPSFSAIIIPFAAASTAAFLLTSQYDHGTIRNMLACGHTRAEIFFSNLITMSAATVIYFSAYQIVSFSVAVLAFGYEEYRLKAALASLSVMLIMIICMSTVLSLLLGNFLRGGKITAVILAVQYALNLSIVLGMLKNDNKALGLIASAFPQSSLFDFSYYTIPDGLAKNLIISTAMIVIFCVIGLIHFNQCDIK